MTLSNKKNSYFSGIVAAGALFALTVAIATPASAQQGGFGGGRQRGGAGGGGGFGGGGFGGGQQRGGFGGQQRGGFQRPAPTLASIPVSVMTPYFNLTEDQGKQIEELQKASRATVQEMQSSFQSLRDQFGNNQNPSQDDRQKMMEQMQKMRSEMQAKQATLQEQQAQADREIRKVMTEEQRPNTPAFLRDVEYFQRAELPAELIKPLNLESAQKVKINTILDKADADRQAQMRQMFAGRQGGGQNGGGANGGQNNFQQMGESMRTAREETHKKILDVLTPDQRAQVEKWEKDHPGARQGGFGGGFGGGGFGFGGGAGGAGGGGGRQRGGGAPANPGTGI
jgi:hypothetical protein